MNTTFQEVVESFERADRAEKERVKRLEQNLAQARKTIASHDRRAHAAEAVVKDNLEACQRADVSFTRELANAGYHFMKRERDEARERLSKSFTKFSKIFERLRNRAETAEYAVGEQLRKWKREHPPFAQALVDAGYDIVKRERDELFKALAPFAEASIEAHLDNDDDMLVYRVRGVGIVKFFEEARIVIEEMQRKMPDDDDDDDSV